MLVCVATLASKYCKSARALRKLFYFCISVTHNPVKRKCLSQVFVEDTNEFSYSLIHHFLGAPASPQWGCQFGLTLLDRSPRCSPCPGMCVCVPLCNSQFGAAKFRQFKPAKASSKKSPSQHIHDRHKLGRTHEAQCFVAKLAVAYYRRKVGYYQPKC